ncbi:hypothetical protein [Pedobacter sp. BMA]|uniref:hypothetical protein n=1 Tax=Pedobacter sp. BMA TaxID=1663685 RepID=UPI000649DFCE|nr:hypothetical protein [Pedobacter sp. BMA]KLT63955.1 hypothetical protein AB669_19735 [Pedobacter sp. BMA]
MTNREVVRLYLTEELKDSTRGMFSLAQTSSAVGMEPGDLTAALKELVLDKVITIFEQENPDDVFIELQL